MLAAAFALLAPTLARAEYPERQVTMIVCFGAGGGTDIAARLISEPLSKALGKPVVVENRAGAGGNLGIQAVARAAPDGYTLLVCSSAFVVNPSLYVNANYDPIKDFAPVMVLGGSPNVYTVKADSKIKSLPEFIAAVKANSGKTNWTSPGVGTTPYLAGEILKTRASLDMLHIPYKAVPQAVQAVLAGDAVMMTANYGSVAGQIESGLLRALAQTGKTRWPEIRTFRRSTSSASRMPKPTPAIACGCRPERRSRSSTAWSRSFRRSCSSRMSWSVTGSPARPSSPKGRRHSKRASRAKCRCTNRSCKSPD